MQKTNETAKQDYRAALMAGCGLGLTQLVGWGTTFSPLVVLGTVIGNDLGIAREIVFGGITVMLLVSAAIAPIVGAKVDRYGARPVMMLGSVTAAAALVVMSRAQGVYSYALAWMMIGLSMPMSLSNAAMPGLVQVVGRASSRRWITLLMLISGLTSTFFLPLTAFLLKTIGWRDAYLVFAAMQLCICLPIHMLVLPKRRPRPLPLATGSAIPPADEGLPPERRRVAFLLLATWACTEGFISWGLNMQIVDALTGLGLPAGVAIAVWTLSGPSQASARLAELLFGGRYSILSTALFSALLLPVGFVLLLIAGTTPLMAAILAITFGVSHGFYAIARNTLPLVLFGQKEYGWYMGRLSVPQNIVNGIAPILFAAAISRLGPGVPLIMATAAALTGSLAVLLLVRHCRAGGMRLA